MEMEDDLFFADLSKRISLLIMDEDDIVLPPPPWPSYPLQDSFGVTASIPTRLPRHQQPGHVQEKNHRGTREVISKGTGVFIPRFAQPGRKKRFNHPHHCLTRQSSSFHTQGGSSSCSSTMIMAQMGSPKRTPGQIIFSNPTSHQDIQILFGTSTASAPMTS